MTAKRNFGLDLARALAIVMVYASHGVTALGSLGCGVILFFVLSGFLIGRIYLRSQSERTFTLWGFWRARWFRTLPPYYAALGLFALFDFYFHSTHVHPYYLLFLQNFLGTDGFGPSWSLCVEEHFYLALPLIGFLLLRTLGRRSLLWALPLLALLPELLRGIAFASGSLPPQWYFRTQYNAEGLILGVWLAYVFLDRAEVWRRLRKPAFVLAILPLVNLAYTFLYPAPSLFYQVSANLIYAVGFAAWLRLLYDLRWEASSGAAKLIQNTVHGIALASYSIYLVHTLFFTDLRILLDGWSRGPLKSVTIMLVTLAFSIVFYFAIERPSITVRDRTLHGS